PGLGGPVVIVGDVASFPRRRTSGKTERGQRLLATTSCGDGIHQGAIYANPTPTPPFSEGEGGLRFASLRNRGLVGVGLACGPPCIRVHLHDHLGQPGAPADPCTGRPPGGIGARPLLRPPPHKALAVLPVEVQLRERRGLDMEAGAPPGVGLQPARDGGPRLPGGAEGGAVALEPGAGGLASAPRRRRHLRGCCATVVGTKKMPEKKSSHARGSYCTPFLDPAL
ncbi:unnamed protein product, partial [Prorocentrum cordatum]